MKIFFKVSVVFLIFTWHTPQFSFNWRAAGIAAVALTPSLVADFYTVKLAKSAWNESREYWNERKELEKMNLKIKDSYKEYGNRSEHTISLNIPKDLTLTKEQREKIQKHWARVSTLHRDDIKVWLLSWTISIGLIGTGYGCSALVHALRSN